MNRTIILGVCTILGLCAVLRSPLLANGWAHPRRHPSPNAKQPKDPAAEPVSFHGTVQSITATHIEVLIDKTDADDKSDNKTDNKSDNKTNNKNGKNKKAPHGTWSVLVPHDTPVHVTGEATPDYLHHGIMVRFTVQGDGKAAAETVHQLTIVTAASRKPVHKGAAATKPADKAPAADAQDGDAQRTVVGQLGHLHDNQWSVVADGKTWHIQLADDVKIKVAFTGSHFVSPGDKIVVQGEMIHGKPGECAASSVQVTLAKPLSPSKDAQKRHKSESGPALPNDKNV
jgi:hypothetical protein